MNIDTVKATTREFFDRTIPNHELNDADDIFASGFVNSLFAMQLVMFVEKEFNLTVEDDDLNIDNFRSVDAIAALVSRYNT